MTEKPSDPPHELDAYKQYCKDLRKGWTQMYKRLLEKDKEIEKLKNQLKNKI